MPVLDDDPHLAPAGQPHLVLATDHQRRSFPHRPRGDRHARGVPRPQREAAQGQRQARLAGPFDSHHLGLLVNHQLARPGPASSL